MTQPLTQSTAVIASTHNTYVAESEIVPEGRGVFASRHIEPGELFERVPVIVIPNEELPLAARTLLYDYYYDWNDDLDAAGVALGFGSLYNHSFDPSAAYEKHFAAMRIDFTARRLIRRGEEITINYNGTFPTDDSPLKYDWARAMLVDQDAERQGRQL